MPKDSFLEGCGSRVDAILVQGRWKRGQRRSFEFIAAKCARSGESAENAHRLVFNAFRHINGFRGQRVIRGHRNMFAASPT